MPFYNILIYNKIFYTSTTKFPLRDNTSQPETIVSKLALLLFVFSLFFNPMHAFFPFLIATFKQLHQKNYFMLNQTEKAWRMEAEMKLLKELEARYNRAILENEAFALLKKLFLEIKQLKERLDLPSQNQLSY